MSSLDIPLSAANSIYNFSVVVLVGGMILVLISGAALIWSGLIKERYAHEKIVQDEALATKAYAAAEKARADAAEAQRRLAQAQAEAQAKAEAAAAVPVVQPPPHPAPDEREISPEKQARFKEYVRNFAKGRIFVVSVPSDPEAAQYARQLLIMLTEAGYQAMPKPDFVLPPEEQIRGVHVRIRSMAEQPIYAGSLQKALEYIDIDTAGELDEAAENSVLILVGNKP